MKKIVEKTAKVKKASTTVKAKGVHKDTDKVTAKVKTPKAAKTTKTNDKKPHFQVAVNAEMKAMIKDKAERYTKGNISSLVRYAAINFDPTAKQKKELDLLS